MEINNFFSVLSVGSFHSGKLFGTLVMHWHSPNANRIGIRHVQSADSRPKRFFIRTQFLRLNLIFCFPLALVYDYAFIYTHFVVVLFSWFFSLWLCVLCHKILIRKHESNRWCQRKQCLFLVKSQGEQRIFYRNERFIEIVAFRMVERLILNQRGHGTRKNASLCVARRLNKTIFKMIRHYRWKLVRNAGQICSRFFTFTFRCRWNACQQMLKCEFTSLSVDESQGSTMKSKLSVGKSIHWFEIWSMYIWYLSQNIEFPCKRTFN